MEADNLASLVKALHFIDEEVAQTSTWLFEKTKGKMYWVSACLQNLFLGGYVEPSLRGWRIPQGKSLKEVAIPNQMAQAMEVKFKQMDPHNLEILQICAEAGITFNSNLIAKMTGKRRTEVLLTLQQIQEETNIIKENPEAAASND